MSNTAKSISNMRHKRLVEPAKKYTKEDVERVMTLVRAAQFDLGRKTDAVKLIRKERS